MAAAAAGARRPAAIAELVARRADGPTHCAIEVDTFVADFREQHRRRPRLQLEFDRAGPP
ncbi:hypothetical protein [Mycobacterium helveticum]|jgi:hypothetical protein|uniref:Uncharacterized protein n=1 Tax=Mycobacterium helveticum TaxID=2592811 RepID=A0A557XDE7_9MYCO|nr:hypothetical protein [Mycobacterium helveticum]TVS78098.1 hypothetical protein FPZ46_23825 [Mycobacterium helveticum]TVS83574.1 hypothetical protein FPZ47_23340 [Mycobacterium helveticum]